MTRPRRRIVRLLAQAAVLVVAYRSAASHTARRRSRRAQERWAAVASAGRRPSAQSPAPDDDGPVPGQPRLYLPAGDRSGNVPSTGATDVASQRVIVLGPGRLVLGSGPDAGLRVDDPAVAAAHAEVVVQAATVHLRDLTGTGRVRVDGVPVLDADLVDGNRITIGGHDLVFHRDADPGPGREGGEGS